MRITSSASIAFILLALGIEVGAYAQSTGAPVLMDAVAPLGLRLEPQKQVSDMLVLDQVERPVPQN